MSFTTSFIHFCIISILYSTKKNVIRLLKGQLDFVVVSHFQLYVM